jgi:hypothetical protein
MLRGDRDSDRFVNLGGTARATTQVQPSHTAVLVPRYVHDSRSTAGRPPAGLPGRGARVDGRPPHPHAQPAWPRTPAHARVRRHRVGSGAGHRRSGARHLRSRGAHRGRPGCDLPAGARRAGRRAVRLRLRTAHATTTTTSSTGRCGSTSRSSSGPSPRSSSPAVADGRRTAEAIGTAPRVASWASAAGPRGCGSVGSASSARRSGRLAWNSGTTSACSSADGR